MSRTRTTRSRRSAAYQFDAYRTWIVRGDVLSRLDGEETLAVEQVPRPAPHPRVEDLPRGGFALFIV